MEDGHCQFQNEKRSSVKHLSRHEVDPCAVERLWPARFLGYKLGEVQKDPESWVKCNAKTLLRHC